MQSTETDAELITRIRNGERDAYRPIVQRYQSRLHSMIMGMVRNTEDARDLTQGAFIKAYENIHDFRIESSFYTWLYRIARNLTIDHCRKGTRRRTSALDDAIAPRDDDGNILESTHAEAPEKLLRRKELRERIFGALDELAEEHREIILLREIDGLSYKEIAEILNLPEGTVMSRLFYARRKLQVTLKDLL
jgi:RNA polymerase sigma-70 factor (ECF subfamily)